MLFEHFVAVQDVLGLVVDQVVDTLLPIVADGRGIERDVGIVADVEVVDQVGDRVLDLAQVVRTDVEPAQARVLVEPRGPLAQAALTLGIALAYTVSPAQLSGPNWNLSNELYDISSP